MSETAIRKLEARMETLVESLFTRLVPGDFTLRDIAILLLRAMEDNVVVSPEYDNTPIAPDTYRITLHPDSVLQLQEKSPDYPQRLADLVAELAAESGFRLLRPPWVTVDAGKDLTVQAQTQGVAQKLLALGETKVAPSVTSEASIDSAASAELRIPEGKTFELSNAVINIGRGTDNDIVIDDPYVSRHHLQLRQGDGRYSLYDVNSRGGSRVNNIVVTEHALRSGDRIQIGRTVLEFADSSPSRDETTKLLAPD